MQRLIVLYVSERDAQQFWASYTDAKQADAEFNLLAEDDDTIQEVARFEMDVSLKAAATRFF